MTGLLRLFLSVFVLLSTLTNSNASSMTAAPPAAAVATTSSGAGNPVANMAGYIKKSIVGTIDGCGMLWKNHKRCNDIRSKQRDHRERIQAKWEVEGRMAPADIKQRLKAVNGGISYEEYSFLIKGKEDRGKLMNVVFLMWGAPRFLPYALMFSPGMLPSPFASLAAAKGGGSESVLEKMSRERAHSVIQTLLNMENDAKMIPALAKINIFGKKAQQAGMESMQMMGALTSKILTTPSVRGSYGAQVFLNTLDHHFFRTNMEYTRGENRLMNAPKSLVRGVVTAVDGPSPLGPFMPNFMNRGKVISHLKKISECDDFLVQEGIDLNSLDTVQLLEACNERLIGVPGRSDEELRESLSEWLKLVVIQPSAKLQQGGKHYNGNLAKFSLLCYNALDATRDERSASYLPRTLFQGQIQDTQTFIEAARK